MDLISLTSDIVSAHVTNNNVPAAELPALIKSVHDALAKTNMPTVVEPAAPEPAVPIRSSIKHDYIVCLEDGKKLKMLKRYLRTNFAMTPEEYRTKWSLPRDYPMVAPAYAETRKELAVKIGLGRKPRDLAEAMVEPVRKAGKTLGIFAAKAAAAVHLGTDAEVQVPARRGRPKKIVEPQQG
ncbi:MucR family transcriptional regulator [Sphingomonas abietis]|uniref:MucR family transcriptional regulator n=1 Tax=Sphingomonas abietis TaxID=3012344 RepID=UPI00389B28FB